MNVEPTEMAMEKVMDVDVINSNIQEFEGDERVVYILLSRL